MPSEILLHSDRSDLMRLLRPICRLRLPEDEMPKWLIAPSARTRTCRTRVMSIRGLYTVGQINEVYAQLMKPSFNQGPRCPRVR